MLKNSLNDPNITLSKKDLISPIISMVAFLLIIIGSSYAYFTKGSMGSAANVGANVQLPARCIASVTNTTCSSSLMQLQMTSNKVGTNTTSTCGVSVTVNGNKNCHCSYDIFLNTTSSFASSVYVSSSITYQLTGSYTVPETSVSAGWGGGGLIATDTITIATTGTAITKTYNLIWRIKNINANQDVMAGRSFNASLEFHGACSIPTS